MRDDPDPKAEEALEKAQGAAVEAEEKPSRSSRPSRRAEEPPTITKGSTEGGRRRSANLRHTQRGRFTVEGPSGTPYAFGSHGMLKVKGEDVEALLAIKRVQRTCCGPRAPQVIYPLVRA